MSTERILRHPNGGAQKIGLEVHVSADSYCVESEIRGTSEVFSSTVAHSRVSSSKVFNSRVMGSRVGISTVAESTCSGLLLHGAILHKVTAASKILTGVNALTLVDVVAENCELYGNWYLTGNARIHEGRWDRPPRFRCISGDNGVSFGLTECKPGYAMLGCWCKPLTELLKAGPRLGRKRGWTAHQINQARDFYEMLLDCPLEGVEP